jgi:hypothetical protein
LILVGGTGWGQIGGLPTRRVGFPHVFRSPMRVCTTHFANEEVVMALATHTVAINAAFLQEIKDDHHELRQLMHHAGGMFARGDWMPAELGHLSVLLGKLRDQLAMHFSLEEAFGYFDDAIESAPHLSRHAEELRAQHAEMYSELCRLADLAERLVNQSALEPAMATLAADYRAFAVRFGEHESQETQLIVEAFNSDIGAGD